MNAEFRGVSHIPKEAEINHKAVGSPAFAVLSPALL